MCPSIELHECDVSCLKAKHSLSSSLPPPPLPPESLGEYRILVRENSFSPLMLLVNRT